MPDAPLTRETLAELRRLKDAEMQAWRVLLAAPDGEDDKEARAFDDAVHRTGRALHHHFSALLAAAERGLGAGDAA